MASDDDFDLDDDNFDDFDNMDFDAMEGDVPDDRSPATKVGQGFKEAVKFQFTQPQKIEELARGALPDSYGRSLTKAQEIGNAGADIYRQSKKEAEPGLRNLRKIADKNMDKIEKILPKSWANKLKETIQKEKDQGAMKAASDQTDMVNSSLDAIFKQREIAKGEKESIDEAIEEKENSLSKIREDATMSMSQAAAEHLSKLVGYQETVLSSFQRKTLELQYHQFFVARDQLEFIQNSSQKSGQLLEAIVKNTALPEIQKLRMSEAAEGTIRDRIMGSALNKVSNYASGFVPSIKKNMQDLFSEKIEAFNDGTEKILDMQDEDAPALDKYTLFGDILGSFSSDFIIRKLGEHIKPIAENEEKIKKFGLDAEFFMSSLSERFLKWKNGESDSQLMELVKEIIPELQQQAFNDQSDFLNNEEFVDNRKELMERSIIEIIPGYLSKISRWTELLATGNDNGGESYNIIRGGFTTRETLADDIRNKVVSKGSAATLFAGGEEVLKAFDKDGTLSEEAHSAFRATMLELSQKGRGFDIEDLAKAETYGETTKDHIREELAKLFSSVGQGSDMTLEEKEARQLGLNYMNAIKSSVGSYDDIINKMSYYGNRDLMREMGLIRLTAAGTNEIDTRLIDRLLLSDAQSIADSEEGRKLAGERLKAKKEAEESKEEAGSKRGFFGRVVDGMRRKKQHREKLEGEFVEERELTPEEAAEVEKHLNADGDEDGFVEKRNETDSVREVKTTLVFGAEQEELTQMYRDQRAAEAPPQQQTIELDGSDLATATNQERLYALLEECCRDKGIVLNDSLKRLESIDESIKMVIAGGGSGGAVIHNAMPLEAKGFWGSMWDAVNAGSSALFGREVKDDPETAIDESQDEGLAWKAIKGVGGFYKKMFGLAGSVMGAGGKLIDGIAGTPIQDIFMEGLEDPIMKKAGLKKGLYIDLETGKPIRYPEDVTGPVLDKDGNKIIDEADIDKRLFVVDTKKGFIERNAGRAMSLAEKGVGLVGGFYGGLFEGVKKIVGALTTQNIADIYIAGEDTPRLAKWRLEAGHFIDKETGKVIQTIGDITGPVIDRDNNVILSAEDLKKDMYSKFEGVVNIWEKVKSGAVQGLGWAKNKIPELVGKGIDLGKGYLDFIGKFYGSIFDTIGETFNFGGNDVTSNERYNRDVLIEIRDMINVALLDGEYETESTLFEKVEHDGLHVRLKERFLSRWGDDESGGFFSRIKGFFTKDETESENGIVAAFKKLIPTLKEKTEEPKEEKSLLRMDREELATRFGMDASDGPDKVNAEPTTVVGSIKSSIAERAKGALDVVPGPIKDVIASEKSKELLDKTKGKAAEKLKTLNSAIEERSKQDGLLGKTAKAFTSVTDKASGLFNKEEDESKTTSLVDNVKSMAGRVLPSAISTRLGLDADQPKTSLLTSTREELAERFGVDESKPLPEEPNVNDQDGDGFRDGSWQAKRAAEEPSKLDTLIALLTERFASEDRAGDQKSASEESGGLLSMLKDKYDSLKDRFFPDGDDIDLPEGDGGERRGRGRGGKKPGLLRRMAGKLGTIARGGARLALGAVPMAGSLLSGAGTMLATAGGAIGSIISAPVVLGGLAVAGAGYLAYKAYKHYTKPVANDYDKIRYVGYGVDFNDEEQMKKIALLEDAVEDSVNISGSNVSFNSEAIKPEELAKALGIDKAGAPMEYQEFLTWFNSRFRRFYLMHRGALNNLGVSETSALDEETGSKYISLMEVNEEDSIWSSGGQVLGMFAATTTAADLAETKSSIGSESTSSKSKHSKFTAPVAKLETESKQSKDLARSVASVTVGTTVSEPKVDGDHALSEQIEKAQDSALEAASFRRLSTSVPTTESSDRQLVLLEEQLAAQRHMVIGIDEMNGKFEALVRSISGRDEEEMIEDFKENLRAVMNERKRQNHPPAPPKGPKVDMS